MGRFFQTSGASFVDDNMYRSPIELMQGVLATHEKRTDDLVAKTDILEGATDQIGHLNFDAENKRVKGIQAKYSDAINDIAAKIQQDPLNYRQHAPALKSLQREMLADKTSGEWYQIEKRQSDYQNWVKDNADLRDSNPTLYNKLNQHYYSDIVQRGTEDPNAIFRGQKGIDKPDLIKGYSDQFAKIKASSTEQSNGRYKIGEKWISEDEVANIAWNTLLSDKNYAGYVNQMGNILGESGYIDEEGKAINAFNLVDGTGKVITFEEYQNLDDESKKGVSRQLNPNNAFYSDLSAVAQTYSFKDRTMAADPYGLINARGNVTARNIGLRQRGAIQLEMLRQQGKSDLLSQKYALQGEKERSAYKADLAAKAASGDESAVDTLNQITMQETIGVIGNPPADIKTDLADIKAYRERLGVVPDGQTVVRAPAGTTEYAAQQRWTNATQHAINNLGTTTINLSNGSKLKATQYFEFLGDREHTEELAREFLEKRKGIYVREGGDKSLMQDFINNARVLPTDMKSIEAQDWDAVYELGNQYEEKRNEWYKDYSSQTSQISLQPIVNQESSTNMVRAMQHNPEAYTMVDEEGNVIADASAHIQNFTPTTELSVTSANAHSQMGMHTQLNGKNYYFFPSNDNQAAQNLMVNLSLKGVDPNSQYFMEMSNRVSSDLMQQIHSSGLNSAGTKSIVTKVNGKLLSLEIVGDKVNVRDPNATISSTPSATFDNVQHFVNTMYTMN